MFHLLKGSAHYTPLMVGNREIKIWEKSSSPCRIRTQVLLFTRHALYPYATIAAPMLILIAQRVVKAVWNFTGTLFHSRGPSSHGVQPRFFLVIQQPVQHRVQVLQEEVVHPQPVCHHGLAPMPRLEHLRTHRRGCEIRLQVSPCSSCNVTSMKS